MSKPMILIVDDDAGIRSLLRLVAERVGCNVDTAADGVEALSKLRQASHDLVLLDLMMPKLDGYGVVEAMTTMASRPPVIIVTAGNDDTARLNPEVVTAHHPQAI